MRSLIAASLLFHSDATLEETSLMQGLVARRGQLTPDASSSRKDSTTKLMETATKMMKNGATPDVLVFINDTIWEIENVILQAVVDDHRRDQELIVASRNRFEQAIADMQTCAATVNEQQAELEGMIYGHKQCRQEEAVACARSRKCEDELEELWLRVVTVETEMRRIHWAIHGEWCVPPLPPHPGLADPWNWPDEDHYEGPETSESDHLYPEVNQGDAVIAFRTFTVEHFGLYIIQLPIVEEAWEAYNRKLLECAAKEETWQLKVQDCDDLQVAMNDKACEHHADNRQCASDWAIEYEMAMDEYSMLIGNGMYVDGDNAMHPPLYNYLVGRGISMNSEWTWGTTQCDVPGNPPLPECTALPLLEFERKREWESLSIVLCLLRTVYTHVIHSIDSGEPCPTIENQEEQTVAEINYCHTIDFAAAGTANLTLEWFEPPDPPHVPPVIPEPCTLEFEWMTTGFLPADLITSHNDDLRIEDLETYNALISAFGWPGCAPALSCVPCESADLVIDPNYNGNTLCKENHAHLNAGELSRDTFKCLSGDQCIPAGGRCNEINNCDDGSDEIGCDTAWGTPAVLHQETCNSPFFEELQFRCADNVHCTHIFGKCNGINNCEDGSDEVGCATTTHGVTLESGSGYTMEVLQPEIHTHVFFDREYTIDSLGSFAGHSFIKMSNEDKHIVNGKIQYKLRLPRPTVLYVLKLDSTDLSWLETEGWSHTQLEGISYHGARRTRHTDWSQELSDDHYATGSVWQKTFSAGTVWIRGNNGGDGSFVMFLANVGNTPQPPNLPGHDTYIGCFTDDSARDLGPMVGVWQNSATNTYELCRAECTSRGNLYMSLQWGGECFCANAYATADQYYQVDDSNCNVVREPCSPNSHNCGGTWHQAIYHITSPNHYGTPRHNDCPTSEVTEAECLAAVQALLPKGTVQGRTHLVAGSWGWVPPGCSVQSHFTHGVDGDWAAHFNRNANGKNDGGYTPVCEADAADFVAVAQNTKCPWNSPDRLFRSPESGSDSITLEQCYARCATTAGCQHFSHGFWEGAYVCQGCDTLANADAHDGFTAYTMHTHFVGATTDGCRTDNNNPDADRGDQTLGVIPYQAQGEGDTAAVRCCSHDGNTCESDVPGCHDAVTYAEAESICAAADMRICSRAEMDSGVCCGTGCWYNHFAVWVS